MAGRGRAARGDPGCREGVAPGPGHGAEAWGCQGNGAESEGGAVRPGCGGDAEGPRGHQGARISR